MIPVIDEVIDELESNLSIKPLKKTPNPLNEEANTQKLAVAAEMIMINNLKKNSTFFL